MQILLQNFAPFISLFTGGNADTQISMADMVSRIKHVSHLLCWNELGFREPVHAYLKRKLRFVMRRVQEDMSLHAMQPKTKTHLLENGAEYYCCAGETDECGRLIYFPATLLSFNISGGVITALVHSPDDNGKLLSLFLKVSTALAAAAFVPKAKFEKDPVGIVCKYLAEESSGCKAPPVDWSTYESDISDILTHLAARCEHFKMDAASLPDTGRSSPYSISNGYSSLQCTQIDHGMSFQPFFSEKLTSCDAQQLDRMLDAPALREINRCFFIHLGVALGLHPIAMQAVFRAHSNAVLKRIQLALSQKTHEDDQRFDEVKMLEGALQSVLNHNDMIEAPILSIVWPQEFQVHRGIAAHFLLQF